MPFIASLNVLPWNSEDDDPLLDTMDNLDTVQVLRIDNSKFTSSELIDYAKLPQAVPILDDPPPTIDDSITIEVKGVAINY